MAQIPAPSPPDTIKKKNSPKRIKLTSTILPTKEFSKKVKVRVRKRKRRKVQSKVYIMSNSQGDLGNRETDPA